MDNIKVASQIKCFIYFWTEKCSFIYFENARSWRATIKSPDNAHLRYWERSWIILYRCIHGSKFFSSISSVLIACGCICPTCAPGHHVKRKKWITIWKKNAGKKPWLRNPWMRKGWISYNTIVFWRCEVCGLAACRVTHIHVRSNTSREKPSASHAGGPLGPRSILIVVLDVAVCCVHPT